MEVSPFNPSELYSRTDLRTPGYANIICLCGEEYVYPVAVRVDRGGKATEVTKAGTKPDRTDIRMKDTDNPLRRGVVIEVEFNCESGCKFVQVFTFHKGWTFARLLFGPGEPLPTGDLTIWRG